MEFTFGPRRGIYHDITDEINYRDKPFSTEEVQYFETFDLIYRSLCTLLFNYAPRTGKNIS